MRFTIAACLSLATFSTHAKEPDNPTVQEGNLVEYFGREKVEEVAEGETIHIFRKGLLLPMDGSSFGFSSGATPLDPVFARFLTRRSSNVVAGDVFDVSSLGRPMAWEAISANEKNTFRDARLRSGALRVRYESDEERNVLLDVAGPTWVIVNGEPRCGDHYNFGYTLLPVRIRQGVNEIVMKGGRFAEVRVRLVAPKTPILFTSRHTTQPDLLRDERQVLYAAMRVINTTNAAVEGHKIVCTKDHHSSVMAVPSIPPLSSIKAPFKIPSLASVAKRAEDVQVRLSLRDAGDAEVATNTLTLAVRNSSDKHRRTFVSGIDGSVQYYAVTPPSVEDLEKPAMFLSVHGASVEAINQVRAYDHKDWGYLVAPTNRGPYGFAWEDWGRLDAMEVLEHAECLFGTDPARTYLTGHSMGGHGAWYLGATYPDRFAAVAPCAGYPDLLAYRDGFRERLLAMTIEQREQFGLTAEVVAQLTKEPSPGRLEQVMLRAGNPSRTMSFIENHKQHGLYILHGESDTVVPTAIARAARSRIGSFHDDFTYYEHPNGTHWYGDESVDWPPIFAMFRDRRVPDPTNIDAFTFATASPGVSASSCGVTIRQQNSPLEFSRVRYKREEKAVSVHTDNVEALTIDASKMEFATDTSITVDDTPITLVDASKPMHLNNSATGWLLASTPPSKFQKGPHRYGGFKDAFRHRFVLVYGTGGAPEASAWAFTKARFDAEVFGYRGNGRVELVPDNAFAADKYADRNVIIYGNRNVNSAWSELLYDSPLQIAEGGIVFGEVRLTDPGLGAYFVYPRPGSEVATVGVVAATGPSGRLAATGNQYLVNGNGFPDVTLFDSGLLENGAHALRCVGFWGADWSIAEGDFEWR